MFAFGYVKLDKKVAWAEVRRLGAVSGIPKNMHSGCPHSREYRHPDAYIYVNIGIQVPIFTVNIGIWVPIFTVNMGILL